MLLPPTMVANDTIMRMLDQRSPIVNRDQLMALAARFMGWILKDHGRRHRREPNAASLPKSSSNDPGVDAQVEDFISVRDAMHELAAISPRAAEVVTLRIYSSCTIEEAALALNVSHATIERQYRTGTEWLKKRLGPTWGTSLRSG